MLIYLKKLNQYIGKAEFLLFISCLILIVFRDVNLLRTPRFWAEEGSLFYSYARHNSISSILINAPLGYLSLINNLVSILQTRLLNVYDAPLVSTLIGLIIQLIPILFILLVNNDLWNSNYKKSIVILFVIFTPPEMWLNTTCSHFVLGLVSFLILISDPIELSKVKKCIFRILLILGSLSGPSTVILMPVFFVRTYLTKSRESNIQFLIISVLGSIQAFLIAKNMLFNHSGRFNNFSLSKTLYAFIVDHFSMQVIRTHNMEIFLGLISFLFFLILFFKQRHNKNALLLFLAFALTAIFSTLGSIAMSGAPRYGYISSCILVIIIMQNIAVTDSTWELKAISNLFFLIIIVVNIATFGTKISRSSFFSNRPNWHNEIKKWENNKNYLPLISPQGKDSWHIKM